MRISESDSYDSSYCQEMQNIVDDKQKSTNSRENTQNANGLNAENHHEYHTGRFRNQIEFWLSSLGSAVGYGNVWRFPYMLYRNGGGTFLIPWSICVVVLILPAYYLETLYGLLHTIKLILFVFIKYY